jgi:hypothetical protein
MLGFVATEKAAGYCPVVYSYLLNGVVFSRWTVVAEIARDWPWHPLRGLGFSEVGQAWSAPTWDVLQKRASG